MSDNLKKDGTMERREFLKLAGTVGIATATLVSCGPKTAPAEKTTTAPVSTAEAPLEVAMPLKGTKIKALFEDFEYIKYLKTKLPEFEAKTGINVEIESMAWGVLLQQVETELAAGSHTYDVFQMIFIKTQRWMRAGWATKLDDYVAKSNFDIDDFLSGTVKAMSYQGGLYGIPYLAESTQMMYRGDKLREVGLQPPQNFDELNKACSAIHNPPDFYSLVMRTQPAGVHFPFPVWLQGFGGNIFRDPPNDLTPTLNTPEALKAAENFVDLILKYSIGGTQTFDSPDCQAAMSQGKAGFYIDALGQMGRMYDPTQSIVSDKVQIALVPGGPAGRFPQIASHGFQIPTGSKNKEAAWEFIQWALSKEVMEGALQATGFSAFPRKSILSSAAYAAKHNKGETKVGELIIEALNLSKCEYRVVPEFPQVGERLGQGLGEIISGQKSVKDAMDSIQADCEQVMIAGGNIITP